MIASMAAVGLGTSFGGSNVKPPPSTDENLTAEPTPDPFLFPNGPAPTVDGTKPYVATIETDKGPITVQLVTDAPEAVNSFAYLAGKGFYNGSVFFYVDHNFFAQAGDPSCHQDSEKLCAGVGGPGYTLPIEKTSEKHEQWAVVAPVASEGGDAVHGSQFRVLYTADGRLDGQETVFGKVTKGQEILQGLKDLAPCSIINAATCDASLSGALVIKDIIVSPA